MNPMQQRQQHGGMNRPANQMNDSMMMKRPRPGTGSWGSMGGYNNNNNTGQNMNKFRSQQQQSNYSWN